MHPYWAAFGELLKTPFTRIDLVWGIVPLYFGLILNELTSDKATFRTAIQTGFSFLWAGAQWLYALYHNHGGHLSFSGQSPVRLLVTLLVLAMGAMALFNGLRKRFSKNLRFLGHTRFANYFMIMIFPIQSHAMDWTWTRLLAIALFAIPVWLLLHFGLMPIRGK